MSAKQQKELIRLKNLMGFNLREAARMKEIGELAICTELRLQAGEMKEQIQGLVTA